MNNDHDYQRGKSTEKPYDKKWKRERPVSNGEVVKEDKHFKLSQLTAWTRVHSISKGQVRVWSRWHLSPTHAHAHAQTHNNHNKS